MKSRTIHRATSSGPSDHSLSAFKAWVTDIAARLTTPDAALTFTDKEWVTFWKEFWAENHRTFNRGSMQDD
jgi:hypothetical protein